jgi:glycosyltransferase involved in cell wall biosynthesis
MTALRCDIAYFPLGAAAFGGAERSVMELAAAQQAAGRRVLLCCERALAGTDFVAQAEAMRLPLHWIDWAPEQPAWRVAGAAWRLFGSLEAPLVHFNISWRERMWIVPLLARWRSPARLIGSMRAMPERYEDTPRRRHFGILPGLQLWKLPDLLVGRIWARALHATVSVNRDDYPPRLRDEFGFPPQRLHVIYNGVRLPEHAPSDEERHAARTALGLPAGAFVVAFVGRVSHEKGVVHAVEALARCAPRVHLVVAGDGNALPAVRQAAADLGVAARVHCLGYVGEPARVFAAAHVSVVPSLWNEAFGRSVVESMGAGVPVIATRVGGMQELFDDGVHGSLVGRGDVPAIAAAIGRLEADPGQLREQGRAARDLALARYATGRVAAEYGRLYAELAGA